MRYRLHGLAVTLVAVVFGLSIAGCDSDNAGNNPAIVGFGPTNLTFASCAPLAGDFLATQIVIVSNISPGLFRNFSGARLRVAFTNGLFTSNFLPPGLLTPVIVSGPFTAGTTVLTLGTQPLLPGIQPGLQRFTCGFEAGALSLDGQAGFDFLGNGIFQAARVQLVLIRL